jgi:Lipocalin-like domain
MDQRTMHRLAVIAAFGLSLLPGSAVAQQKSLKDQLIGTWMIVLCETVYPNGTKRPLVLGDNPLGQFIFTDNGHFSFQMAAEIPKFASGDETKTTPEENKAVVEGSIAYFGTYMVTDADKTIALHIERSSIPNLNGTNGRRIVTTISADEMNWTNPAPIRGGAINCSNKRAK